MRGATSYTFRTIILVITLLLLLNASLALSNPAAVYCEELGYTSEVIKTNEGEIGYCNINGQNLEEWSFFQGKLGKEYSYCAKHGYDLEVINEGGLFTQEYAACIITPNYYKSKSNGNESIPKTNLDHIRIPVYELMNLSAKLNPMYVIDKDKQNIINVPQLMQASLPTGLPSSFDWRDNNGNWLTSVKNQGYCGSCWAFSAVGTAEAKIKIVRNQTGFNLDLSEQELVSCDHWCWPGYSPGSGYCSDGCDGGYSYSSLKYYFVDTGVCDESCKSYTETDGSCSGFCADKTSRTWKLTSSTQLISQSDASIKQYLIDKGPLSISINIGEASPDAQGIYKCSSNPTTTDHAVLLVGYNDAGSYWIIKNSWGPTWNSDGYFKLGYGQCAFTNQYWGPTYAEYTNTACDSTPRCSSGSGDNNYNTDGEYSCLGYKDTSSNCDYADSCAYSATCDPDDDNDGVLDINDNCPTVAGVSYYNGCPDTYAPILRINTPQNNQNLTGNVLINWSSDDYCNLNGKVSIEYYVNSWNLIQSGLNANSTLSWDASGINSKNVKIRVNATDDYLNKNSTESGSFTIDNTLPSITLQSPNDNNITKEDTIYFLFTPTDNLADKLTCKLKINQYSNETTLNNNLPGTLSYNLAEGTYLWNITCKDDSQLNYTASNRNLIIDKTKPTFNILELDNASPVKRSYTIINISATDQNNVSSCVLNWNQTLINMDLTSLGSNNYYCYKNQTGIDGLYYYNISIYDLAGNINTTSQYNITFDTSGPVIDIQTPENTTYGNTTINFQALFTDALSLTDAKWYYLDDDNATPYTGLTYLNSLSEGTHTINVYANDSLGNIAGGNVSFSIDLTPPVINVISPGSNTTSLNTWFNISTNEPASTMILSIDNGSNITMTRFNSTLYYHNMDLSNEGMHSFTIFTNDTLNNANSSPMTLHASIKPVMSETALTKTLILANETLNITFNLQEEHVSNAWINVTLPDGTSVIKDAINTTLNEYPAISEWSTEFNNTSLIGDYNVTVYVNDSLTNTINESLKFSVSEPAVININFSNGASTLVDLSWSICYANTSVTRETNSTSAINVTLPEGLWNINLSRNNFLIELKNVNFSTNTTNEFYLAENNSLTNIPNTDYVFHKVASLHFSNAFNQAVLSIPFNSSGITNGKKVLKCSDWSFTELKCNNVWIDVSANATITNDYIYVNTSSFSAYSLVEYCTASCGSWSTCTGTQSRTCTKTNCETYTQSQTCSTGGGGNNGGGCTSNCGGGGGYEKITPAVNVSASTIKLESNLSSINQSISTLESIKSLNLTSELINNLRDNLTILINQLSTNITGKEALITQAESIVANLSRIMPTVSVIQEFDPSSTELSESVNELIQDAINDLTETTGVTINSHVKVLSIKQASNATENVTQVIKTITNSLNESLSNFTIIEVIPKSYATSTNNVTFHTLNNLIIIQEDPIVSWTFTQVLPGESISINYEVRKSINSTSEQPVSKTYTQAIRTTALNNTITGNEVITQSSTPANEPLDTTSTIIIAVLAILTITLIIARKTIHKKKQFKKNPTN